MANQRDGNQRTKGTSERNREEEGGKERQKVNEKAWFVCNARAMVRMKEREKIQKSLDGNSKKERERERENIDADT